MVLILQLKLPHLLQLLLLSDLFQVNGRIELIEILGSVATAIGAAQTSKFLVLPTVGSSTDLCSAASTAEFGGGWSTCDY